MSQSNKVMQKHKHHQKEAWNKQQIWSLPNGLAILAQEDVGTKTGHQHHNTKKIQTLGGRLYIGRIPNHLPITDSRGFGMTHTMSLPWGLNMSAI